jgi:hypothetical protein
VRDAEPEPRLAQAALECAVVAAGVLAVVLAAPLGSPQFEYAALVAGPLAGAYAVWQAARHPAAACRRWGLVPGRGDEGWLHGCLALGVVGLTGLLPAVAAHLLMDPMPRIGHPAAYLLWCLVQDFVFFALAQRSLEDLLHPLAAVPAAAFLFALSHYPHDGLMYLTGLAGLAWGATFSLWRSLPLVTASHWVLGVFALG